MVLILPVHDVTGAKNKLPCDQLPNVNVLQVKSKQVALNLVMGRLWHWNPFLRQILPHEPSRWAPMPPKARALVRPTKTFLAIVQVQGAKRVLNTPTYCSKNRSRHAPRTQTKGLSTFFGDPNTLKSGPFKECLYPMHPRPNAFVVRTEFKSARVFTRVI